LETTNQGQVQIIGKIEAKTQLGPAKFRPHALFWKYRGIAALR
jgi:hypothetical protein